MTNYNIISISILISWLIFYSILLLRGLLMDHYNYKIESSRQIYKKASIFLVVFLWLILIFTLRFLRQGYSLDVPVLLCKAYFFLFNLSLFEILLLVLLWLFSVIFWLLSLKTLFNQVKKAAKAIFIYFLQYTEFRDGTYLINTIRWNFNTFLVRRVRYFTKTEHSFNLANMIWPRSFYFLEKYVYFSLIPFLIYFDLHLNSGVLTKIFYVLPWFFIYSLIRSFYPIFDSLKTDANEKLSDRFYGDYWTKLIN